jgi:hypothetical protein
LALRQSKPSFLYRKVGKNKTHKKYTVRIVPPQPEMVLLLNSAPAKYHNVDQW